jgi:hypothetical protein
MSESRRKERLFIGGLGIIAMLAGCGQSESPSVVAKTTALIGGTQTIYEPEVGLFHQYNVGECTATLIGPQEFLTAAHCISADGEFSIPGYELQGRANVMFDSELSCSPTNCGTNCVPPNGLQWCCDQPNGLCAQWYPVERAFPQGLQAGANDLAVGRLTQPVTWLTPRTISTSEPVNPSTLTVVGYGCNVGRDQGCAGATVKRYITYNWFGQSDSFYAPGDSGGPTFIGGLFDGGPIVRTGSAMSSGGVDIGADPVQYQQHINGMVSAMQGSGIAYRGQLQAFGFLPAVTNGTVAGSAGSGLRLEAIQIWSEVPNVVLAYRAYVQNVGWQNEVRDGQLAGTVGLGLRMEAVQVRLSSAGPYSNVQYSAYVHNIGWQPWVTGGTPCANNSQCGSGLCASGTCAAGTTGRSLQIEALKVVIN